PASNPRATAKPKTNSRPPRKSSGPKKSTRSFRRPSGYTDKPHRDEVGRPTPDNAPLRVISLGGVGSMGKNLTVIEMGKDIICIDCGSTFPDDTMLGVDLVLPDVTYLERNKHKVRAFVITHGHEDHIGSIPY